MTELKKNLRNCRCCSATYEKPTDYWSIIPQFNLDGSMVEPIGFCEFCDKNNKVWYDQKRACHKLILNK